MIVKDEAHVIRRCLDSVRGLIDHWVIVDTGSSDGTQDVVRECLAEVPGELSELPWRGFGQSRTDAIRLASGKADYLLFIDADDVLQAPYGFAWPALTADAYEFTIAYGEITYRRVCLVRNELKWRFEGVLHEYLECDGPFRTEALDGPVMRIVGGGSRSKVAQRDKFLRDADTLEAALKEEPGNTRYAFYLAQSYRDAGDIARALAAYDRRATMGGFDQEVFLSVLYGGRMAALLQHPPAEVIDRYLRAFEARPSRAEPLADLLRYLRQSQPRWQLAFALGRRAIEIPLSRDALFVERSVYEWICLDEFAVAAYWAGEFEQCRDACTRLLASSTLPQGERSRVDRNLEMALEKLRVSSRPL